MARRRLTQTFDEVQEILNAVDGKVDKVEGKGLSTNDYSDAEKAKLAGIEAGAEVNVQADWNQSDNTKDDYIKNRTHYEDEGMVAGTLQWSGDTLSSSTVFRVGNEEIPNTYWDETQESYIFSKPVGDFQWIVFLTHTSGTETLEVFVNVRPYGSVTIRDFATRDFSILQSSPLSLGLEVPGTILQKLDNKYLDLDSAPTSESGKPVTSGGVYTALAGKQDTINDLETIRSGAAAGATAYQKPVTGIPSTDIASGVIPDVSNFITKSVNDLVNYYLKTETYTQTEVNNLIGAIQQFHYEIAASTSAVTDPQSNVLYLIGPTGSGADKYEEYVYSSNTWVKIGDTSIDLSGYVTTSALNTALADYTPTANLAAVATSGSYNDLTDKPTIPDAQIQSDWNQADDTKKDYIKNKPTIPDELADLTDDATHRLVTDTDKAKWNAYENFAFVQGTSSAAGNGDSGSYLSTKWEGVVPGTTTLTNGMKIAYRIATNTGVSTAGAVLSIDGGTTYKPVVFNVNSVITTRYSVGSTLLLTYNSTQTAVGYLTSNTKSTITGCWQIMDYSASNTDTKVRQYQSGANAAGTSPEYPILTRYALTNKDGTYEANYSRFHTGATVNTSTGGITAASFKKTGGTSSQFLKADGSVDSTSYGTYSKPSGGIPASDLASGVIPSVPVQDVTVGGTSVVSSGTAVIPSIPDVSGKEDTSNKVTSISSSSTDTQYPSAKCVYDAIQAGGGGTSLDTVVVSVDDNTGTPSATGSVSGSTLSLAFHNLKGAEGPQGPQGPQGLQGLQGNTGSSVSYPYELINNLTTNDATKGLSAAMGKQLQDTKVGTGSVLDVTADLEISDDSNNVLARFSGGHIKTKNFDSSATVSVVSPMDANADLEISDEEENVLVRFGGGHIKTKNFDSSQITDLPASIKRDLYRTRPKGLLLDYDFSSAISSDFTSNANWSISGGKLVSSSAGVSNRLQNTKKISISQKRTFCKFTARANTYFAVGWLSSALNLDGSMFSIDVANGKFSIHASWTSGSSVPSIYGSKDYTFTAGNDYEMVIVKDGHTNSMYIIDSLSGAVSETLTVTQSSTTSNEEFAGGRQMDRIALIHISGTSPEIYYLRSVADYREPLAIIYGDSITEGDRVYSGQTYSDHLKDYFGEDRIMCSGLSGSDVTSVISRMSVELPLLKPKVVIVAIGTNGGNTQELFNSAKQTILDNDAIPVFCVPPMGYNDLATLRTYIANLNVTTVRFDIATANNNNINDGKNTSLFADTYHPNAAGHLAMAKKLIADCQLLNNY